MTLPLRAVNDVETFAQLVIDGFVDFFSPWRRIVRDQQAVDATSYSS
jgi:hypothetical protein